MPAIFALLRDPRILAALIIGGIVAWALVYVTDRPDVAVAVAYFILMIFLYPGLISAIRAGEKQGSRIQVIFTIPLCGLTAYAIAAYGFPLAPDWWTRILFIFGCLVLLYEFIADVVHLTIKGTSIELTDWVLVTFGQESIPASLTGVRLTVSVLSISLPAMITGLDVLGR
jgi:hypothetical protein